MNGIAKPVPAMGRVLKDSSLYLLGNVVSRLVGFFAIPFYARYLSPAQYGLVELVELSSQTIAIALGLQAIGTALSRLFHDEKTLDGELAVVSTSLIATFALSAAVAVVAMAFAGPISQGLFHTQEWVPLLRGAFFAMFLGEMAEVVLVYERIRNRARFVLVYSLVTMAGLLGLNILFIGFLGFGVWGFVSSKLIVTGLSCAYLLLRARREVGWRWRATYLPELVRFGAPLIVSGLAYFAIHFSDHFFLGSAVSLAELGRYALTYRFAILLSALVGDSFKKSWNVTLYRYVGQGEWRLHFARVASLLTVVLFVTGLGIALFSPPVLRIMVPADYMPPPLLLPILVAAYLARELGDFFGSLLLINKRSVLTGRIAVLSALANLALNALLIPRHGIHGAALATLLTWLLYLVICWTMAVAEHHVPVRVGAYLRITALVVVIYGLAEATRVGPMLLQGVADAGWWVLFCLCCPFVFLQPAERRAAVGLVGTALVPVLVRLPVTGAAAAVGDGVLLLSGRDEPCPLFAGGAGVTQVTLGRQAGGGAAWVAVAGLVLSGLERLGGTRTGLRWLPGAYRQAAGLVGDGTVLCSTGDDAAAHLVAMALKQRFGVPWIALGDGAVPGPETGRGMVDGADAVLGTDADPAALAALVARLRETRVAA